MKPYGLRAAVYDKISDMIGGINLLDETDIRFFSCVVARFEASIILRIFNLPSKSAVYMKKNRIKEKIRKSEAPNKDKFLLF